MTPNDFPRLTQANHRITSPPSPDYNCVAWSAGDTEHWWQPGVYWPFSAASDEYGVGILAQAFTSLGYESEADDSQEPGFEKVALYGSSLLYTHAARQLPSGKWTSKLGGAVDIQHDTPDDVAGGLYGELVEIMKRPRPKNVSA